MGRVWFTDSSQNRNGTVLDSPPDSSQERLADMKVDRGSVLLLLGVMQYQMFAESLAIKAGFVTSQVCEFANEEMPGIRTKHTNFSGRLAININRASNKNFNHRFPTGMEFAGESKAFLN